MATVQYSVRLNRSNPRYTSLMRGSFDASLISYSTAQIVPPPFLNIVNPRAPNSSHR